MILHTKHLTNMKEEWKAVPGYEGIYAVSSSGEVQNLKNHRIRRTDRSSGYQRLTLHLNGEKTRFLVHRLVARGFLCDWDSKLEVDHIDGNRDNNHAENLRMVTKSQNARAYQKTSGLSKFRGVGWDRGAWRAQIRLGGPKIHIGRFKTEIEAAVAYNKVALDNGFFMEALNAI